MPGYASLSSDPTPRALLPASPGPHRQGLPLLFLYTAQAMIQSSAGEVNQMSSTQSHHSSHPSMNCRWPKLSLLRRGFLHINYFIDREGSKKEDPC